MTMIEGEPQPRIDTLVRLPDGGEARRTEYVGTVWLDGKPEVSGMLLRRAANPPRGIRTPNLSTSFFVPDSLAYNGATLGDATLSISVVLQASGETSVIAGAALDSGPCSRSLGLAGRCRLPHRGADAPRRGSVRHKPPRRLGYRTLSQ